MSAAKLPRRPGVALVMTAGLLAAVAGLLLVPLPTAWHGGWRGRLFDLGHVPLFAGLTALLAVALRRPWYWPTLLAVAAAGAGEAAQALTGRSADWTDFLLGAAGAAAVGLLLRAAEGERPRRSVAVHRLAALALTAAAVSVPAPRLIDAAEGILAFPTLADFATPRQMQRWEVRQAELSRVAGGARLVLLPGPEAFPAATLEHIVRDANGYSRLCWSFRVEGDPVTLVFSLRGGPTAAGVTSHYQVGGTFGRGEHRVGIDLATAADGARPNRLDVGDLRYSQVFAIRPAVPCVVHLRRVWLE